jgi:uncharacterized lipoprotein
MQSTRRLAALLAVAALAACGTPEQKVEAVAADDTAGAPAGTQGMQGMGGMQGGGMMEEMRAHMQSMEGKSGEQLKANLPQHRQRVANMISQMNREMREMNMAADPEWNSTIEALREDLKRLPEMSAQEMESFMPEHRQRVMRLMEMHRAMMAGMGM